MLRKSLSPGQSSWRHLEFMSNREISRFTKGMAWRTLQPPGLSVCGILGQALKMAEPSPTT